MRKVLPGIDNFEIESKEFAVHCRIKHWVEGGYSRILSLEEFEIKERYGLTLEQIAGCIEGAKEKLQDGDFGDFRQLGISRLTLYSKAYIKVLDYVASGCKR